MKTNDQSNVPQDDLYALAWKSKFGNNLFDNPLASKMMKNDEVDTFTRSTIMSNGPQVEVLKNPP